MSQARRRGCSHSNRAPTLGCQPAGEVSPFAHVSDWATLDFGGKPRSKYRISPIDPNSPRIPFAHGSTHDPPPEQSNVNPSRREALRISSAQGGVPNTNAAQSKQL